MNQQTHAGDRLVRRYDYEDRTVVAADVGATQETVHAEAVGEQVLVAVEDEAGDEEFELDLPGPATNVETNNGVLAITVER